ncbi:hypothetical protein [Prosthecobacter sp.]|uniref:hypothetical protein n=1 Tax=Prosthecobacter sp. TaxID=1965333 RepID=UPI0037842B60
MGKVLAPALAPLIEAENDELFRKAGLLLTATSRDDISRLEHEFGQKLQVLLREVARVAPGKADSAARHVVALTRAAASQNQAPSGSHEGGLVYDLINSLGDIPQIFTTVAGLADDAGIPHLHTGSGGMLRRFEKEVHDPAMAVSWFTATPFVADVKDFQGLLVINELCPSLLFHLVGYVESHPDTKAAVVAHLERQPATFGVDLLQALFQFDSESPPGSPSLENFVLRHSGEFHQLKPHSASSLVALLKTLMPDLWLPENKGSPLVAALKPLLEVEARGFDDEVSRWLGLKELGIFSIDVNSTLQYNVRLLERLAQSDKPRAVALLDHITRLLAQEDDKKKSGSQAQVQPHHTLLARWLQQAVAIPELFAEVMQHAHECGATANPPWLQAVLTQVQDIRHLRRQPERLIALLDAAHLLDPAATFNPQRIPMEQATPTLLEAWLPVIAQWPEMPPLIAKHHPGSFGTDLLGLILCLDLKEEQTLAFAKKHQPALAAATPEQQIMIASLLHRLGWPKVFSPQIPSLDDL